MHIIYLYNLTDASIHHTLSYSVFVMFQHPAFRNKNIYRISVKTLTTTCTISIIAFCFAVRCFYLGYTKSCDYAFRPTVTQILLAFGSIGSVCSIITCVSV